MKEPPREMLRVYNPRRTPPYSVTVQSFKYVSYGRLTVPFWNIRKHVLMYSVIG